MTFSSGPHMASPDGPQMNSLGYPLGPHMGPIIEGWLGLIFLLKYNIFIINQITEIWTALPGSG